jgi:hypothetical protein
MPTLLRSIVREDPGGQGERIQSFSRAGSMVSAGDHCKGRARWRARGAMGLPSKAPQRAFPAGQFIRLAIGGAADDISLGSDARARRDVVGTRDTPAMFEIIDGQ